MSEADHSKHEQKGFFIGTSGWNFNHWNEHFNAGVKCKDRLRHYAGQYHSVEVSATFYRLQNRQTFERWITETLKDIRFVIKGNQFLTHNKKLSDPSGSVTLEREWALGLGEKLAAVVSQLPAIFRKHIEGLCDFVDALEQDATRHRVPPPLMI